MAASILRSSPLLTSRLARFSTSPHFRPTSRHFRRRLLTSRFFSSSSPSTSFSPLPSPPPDSSLETLTPETLAKSPLQWVPRTDLCGELGPADVGRRVRLCGWVAFHRVHGGLTFINLRDHSGLVQVTTLPEEFPEAYATANRVRLEYVVAVEGTVRARPGESLNKKMKTGDIEVAAENVVVLNSVNRALPFPVTISNDVKEIITEEIRLRYRFLDLRRPQMQSNLRLRHKVVKLIRRYLEDIHDFVEIETPMLSKSTPEGARDFLVPSRVQPGTFYALPQSPQLFKQMLMVSGFERYYQIARCFRDEDLRADRQPEFTQLDMELAFAPLEDILRLNEDLMRHIFHEIMGIDLPKPFPRITYAEAVSRFGSDRPDLRFDLELKDVSNIFLGCSFKIFSDTIENGGIIKALCVPSGSQFFSNTALKKGDVYAEAIKAGAKGLPFLKVLDNGVLDGVPALASCLRPERKKQLLRLCSAKAGDLLLFAVGHPTAVNKILDRLRLFVAHQMGMIDKTKHSILWVTDFPMFEWNDTEQRFEALHHPFTAPNPDDINDLTSARALAYDMVYNGVEIGGGSLRIYKREVQEKVLEIVGVSPKQNLQQEKILDKAKIDGVVLTSNTPNIMNETGTQESSKLTISNEHLGGNHGMEYQPQQLLGNEIGTQERSNLSLSNQLLGGGYNGMGYLNLLSSLQANQNLLWNGGMLSAQGNIQRTTSIDTTELDAKVARLVQLGFGREAVIEALQFSDGNERKAIEFLHNDKLLN